MCDLFLPSQDAAAATVPLPGPAGGRRWRHRREVGVHLHVRQVVPQPPYPHPRDQLAVVQFDPLEVVAVEEVVQRLVSDQRAVVQLQDVQGLAGTGGGAEVPDALVGDELAVGEGEGLEAGTVGGQLGDRGVRDEYTLLQVQALQLGTGSTQCLNNSLVSSTLSVGLSVNSVVYSLSETHCLS